MKWYHFSELFSYIVLEITFCWNHVSQSDTFLSNEYHYLYPGKFVFTKIKWVMLKNKMKDLQNCQSKSRT